MHKDTIVLKQTKRKRYGNNPLDNIRSNASHSSSSLPLTLRNSPNDSQDAVRDILKKEGLYTEKDFRKPGNWRHMIETMED
ncbi:hypothetical protein E3E35_01280 [Thermococcus sp. GR7]|uniref:hypothetical protein n=1 Tax=unclassified Thermococcus TaxID=2627626 RepID=UPI001430032A|nr:MULTISPECIES: hypothetical protein [unclassified Thermococcus]NJE46062.1 hypothetical protein [Thermococcus sp. GR7]NJE78302.1 hypothetical protein [Thermococcus sp. GR4]NJF22259.1 hypothetical protein [Thermococcus sp. GR5]